MDAGWRPYSSGHWLRTDAGWYRASDEPWGWATYHYGRWDLSADFGWDLVAADAMVPAARVSCAYGAGDTSVGCRVAAVGQNCSGRLGGGSATRRSAPRAFVFVNERRLLEPVRPATVIVNNTTNFNQTVNMANVRVVNRT